MGKPVRVAVLTNRSTRGVAIIEALTEAGIRIDALIIDSDRFAVRAQARKAARLVAKRGISETLYRTRKGVKRAVAAIRRSERELDFYRRFSLVVVEVPNANGPESERLLKSLAPDVLVLGGSRILKPHILSIPRIGVLNPHPGLLPAYRGVDVIPWAVYNGDPLGVTVHFVDPGIDTGDIVAQRPFEVQPGDSLGSLRRKADALLGQIMAEVVSQLTRGELTRTPQDRGAGRLYSLMPPDLKAQVKAKLQAMDRA
jgi:methionyl-tRNA formyltransferase